MYLGELQRGTGRTTRMLEAALRASKRDHVCIVAHSSAMADFYKDQFIKMGGSETAVWALSAGDKAVDVFRLQVAGIPPSQVFWDHYAIESRIEHLLREASRFDCFAVQVVPNDRAWRR